MHAAVSVSRLHIGHFLLLVTLCILEPRSVCARVITLGILTFSSPDTYSIRSMEATGSALNIAISNFKEAGWLREHKFRVLWTNGKCNPKVGVKGVIRQHTRMHVEAIIGPACSKVVIPTSYYLSYWNIPIFPHASPDPVLSDKKYYNTLVRVTGAFGPMAEAFIDLFNYYNWKRAVLISAEDGGMCDYGATAIFDSFYSRKKQGFVLAEWIRTPTVMNADDLDAHLNRIKTTGRIVFYCFSMMERHRFVYRANELGLNNGDYVFLYYTLFPSDEILEPWNHEPYVLGSALHERQKAYLSFKSITMASLRGPKVEALYDLIPKRNVEPPWFSNTSLVKHWKGSIISVFLYDAVWLYLLLLNESLAEGRDPKNGTMMFEMSRNRVFDGMSGHVMLDDKADRVPDFWLWSFGPNKLKYEEFLEVAMTRTREHRFTVLGQAFWGRENDERSDPPRDIPKCGFLGEYCPSDKTAQNTVILAVSLGVFVFGLLMAAWYFIWRRRKFESDLQQMMWRVHWIDIEFLNKKQGSRLTASNRSMTTNEKASLALTSGNNEDGILQMAVYKGNTVAIKNVDIRSISLTRLDLFELKEMREISHENLNAFVGACIDIPNICSLFMYCSKGSLQDIIMSETIKLDWMFKSSLIADLVNAMAYLHNTGLHSHGNLTSAKCLVDSRWQLKLSGYGLYSFRKTAGMVTQSGEYERGSGRISTDINGYATDTNQTLPDINGLCSVSFRFLNPARCDKGFRPTIAPHTLQKNGFRFRRLLWTSPEIMRMQNQPRYGTQKGDVYSFAIILQEIVFRALPFFLDDISPKVAVLHVKEGQLPPYRPPLPKLHNDTDPTIVELMKMCWTESPSDRPEFSDIQKKLKYFNKGKKFNILDNMILKLEKYATNLEEIVDSRTQELVEEKKKTDILLYRMLPPTVADNLKQGKMTEAELYEQVTVYFSDVVGFTLLSSESTPMQIVDFLNDLYTLFDDIIDLHDVYKVETIGDAYMVASGLPVRNGDRHVAEIANMALDLLSAIYTKFKIRHRPSQPLKLRSGIHTGPCAAGVVGQRMPRYCLIGDTVNMASRMESTGEALKIHLSQAAHDTLYKLTQYHMTRRGEIEIKGKGMQTTYWLMGREGFSKQLPRNF